MSSSSTTMAAANVTNSQTVKRRAACDECRTKKLKCSGEHPRCSRCEREGIPCIYSPQKTMGRPKKRPRPEDEPLTASTRNGRNNDGAWDRANLAVLQGIETEPIDIGPYASAFTPGGSLQPWLQTDNDWNGDYGTTQGVDAQNRGRSEMSLPGLTPDNSSSHSPPMLNLPPELQTHHSNSSTHGQTRPRNNNSALFLDPTLSAPFDASLIPGANLGCPSSSVPECACLSSMYLTLGTLSSMDSSFAFPFALHPLREAMQTASTVLACTQCPTRFITAIQNTQLVGTLFLSIAERFSKVLSHITVESIRASEAGETKKFRLADLNTSSSHLHTGGLGCVAAFSLDLTPEEWRKMCKKVVKAEVHGPESGNECCCYFEGVLKQMEDRQDRWHQMKPVDDFPRDERGDIVGGPRTIIRRADEEERGCKEFVAKKEDHLCMKMILYARKLVESYDWS